MHVDEEQSEDIMPVRYMRRQCAAALWLAGSLTGTLADAPVAHAQGAACPVSRLPALSLPRSRALLASGQELLVVAFGSSSTEGVMASDAAHAYPAILQSELAASLSRNHVAVINRGIGGQDAPEEVARLDEDVLAIHPALVIWQVGANGAMRGTSPELFGTLVQEGVKRLRAAGADVVLMDNQRSPRVIASPEHGAIEQELAETARQSGASLFPRSMLMDEWKQDGFPYGAFVATDQLHMNDLGYECLARALANSITRALAPAPVAAVATVGKGG